tara:strand:- start:909 stop:1403 length:495 start_codon:yes stop_codon:yes gene_type:complete
MKRFFAFFAALVVAVLAASPAQAADGVKLSDIIWKKRTAENTTEAVLERVFTEAEKVLIGDYYKSRRSTDSEKHGKGNGKGKKNGKSMPPGLAKKDKLPPGLAMQLEKNGKLPPGLEKRDLPDDLESRLPLRKGLKRILAGDNVVLVDTATDIILDVLEGIAQQ